MVITPVFEKPESARAGSTTPNIKSTVTAAMRIKSAEILLATKPITTKARTASVIAMSGVMAARQWDFKTFAASSVISFSVI